MTRPTKNLAVSNSIVVGISVIMVGLPRSHPCSIPITPHQFLPTTLAFSFNYFPNFFDHALRKCHFAPPYIDNRIIALIGGMSRYMFSGRIGVWICVILRHYFIGGYFGIQKRRARPDCSNLNREGSKTRELPNLWQRKLGNRRQFCCSDVTRRLSQLETKWANVALPSNNLHKLWQYAFVKPYHSWFERLIRKEERRKTSREHQEKGTEGKVIIWHQGKWVQLFCHPQRAKGNLRHKFRSAQYSAPCLWSVQ